MEGDIQGRRLLSQTSLLNAQLTFWQNSKNLKGPKQSAQRSPHPGKGRTLLFTQAVNRTQNLVATEG